MKICEKCSTNNADDVAFCTNCGNPLNNTNPAPAAPVAPTAPETQIAPSIAALAAQAQANPAPAPAAPAKKGIDGKTLGLIGVAVVGLIVGVVGIVLAITSGNKKETPAQNNTPAAVANNDDDSDVSTANISGNAAGTAVKVGPYTLTIPKDYPFETTAYGVLITDPTNSVWAANIEYDNTATYSQVSSNLKTLGEYYTNQGAKNVKTGTAKSGNLNYLYVDLLDSTDGIAKTISIFKADSYIFDVITTDGTAVINHGVIDIISPIIANAQSGKTSNREIGFNITTKGVDTLKLDEAFATMDSSEE